MVTSARDWKKGLETGQVELDLPSGKTCLVQRLKPEAFLTSGLIPDTLSAIVTKAIRSKKGLPPEKLEEIAKDPEKLRAAVLMLDQAICYVVLDPHVELPPKCAVTMNDGELCDSYYDVPQHLDTKSDNWHIITEGPRDPDTLYADEVDLHDKNFIFNFVVGGTRDIETFRHQLASGVGDLSTRQTVAKATKRPSRRK